MYHCPYFLFDEIPFFSGVDFPESEDLQDLQDGYDNIKDKFNENDSEDLDEEDDEEDAKIEGSHNDNAFMREDALLDEEANTISDEDSQDLENDQQQEKKHLNEVEIRADNAYEDYDASCSNGK